MFDPHSPSTEELEIEELVLAALLGFLSALKMRFGSSFSFQITFST